jgi:hypothetical protein
VVHLPVKTGSLSTRIIISCIALDPVPSGTPDLAWPPITGWAGIYLVVIYTIYYSYFFQEYGSRLAPKMESEIDIRS